jgi:hypothetical protein
MARTSENSDSSPMVEGDSLRLWLPGYLPPSLNVLLHCHWTERRKLQAVAARAVWFALQSSPYVRRTRTIAQGVASTASTDCVTKESSKTTTPKALSSLHARYGFQRRKSKARKLKSSDSVSREKMKDME